MSKLDTLEKLADAATPGPWSVYEDCAFMVAVDTERFTTKGTLGNYETANICKVDGSPMFQREEDAAFIAAANPQTVKQLIALIRQCKEALTSCYDGPHPYTAETALAAIDAWERGE